MHRRTNNHPLSIEELNATAKDYCSKLVKRMRKNRIDDNKPNKSIYGFNIPKVVVACTSNVAPFFACRGRNNTTLQNPHPTLNAAYPKLNGSGHPISKPYPNVNYYPAGHCAEPHAAHKLLMDMDGHGRRITIGDIVFSLAFDVKNQAVVKYCGTCRLTFPQLR